MSKEKMLPKGPSQPALMGPKTYEMIRQGLARTVDGRRSARKKNSMSEGGTIVRVQSLGIDTTKRFDLVPVTGLTQTNVNSKDANGEDLYQYTNQNILGVNPVELGTSSLEENMCVIALENIITGDIGRAIAQGVATLRVDEVVSLNHKFIEVKDPQRVVTSDKPSAIRIIFIGQDINAGDTDVLIKVYLGGGGGGGTGVAIPLSLTTDGGAQGTGTTTPTWTYEVDDWLTGQNYLVSCDPAGNPHYWVRHIGQMTEATFGWGFIDPDTDSLIVTWVNEQSVTAICDDDLETTLADLEARVSALENP